MSSTDKLKRFFKKSELCINSDTDKKIFQDVLQAQQKTIKQKPAQPENIGRLIMKSQIVKLAASAVFIVLVVLGLLEFIGTGKSSGIVWADVVKKVQASKGLIVRSIDINPSSEDDYSITYTSPNYCRKDFYQDGQIIRNSYVDFTAPDINTLIDVFHNYKLCLTTTYKKNDYGLFLEWHEDWTKPGFLVQRILSVEHNRLGRKTIDGVLCEGIETTDPACLYPLPEQVNNLQVEFRLWVSTETGYPVLYESKISGEYKGQWDETGCVMDQFQWDVELDSSTFEPNIPSGYETVTRPGIVEP